MTLTLTLARSVDHDSRHGKVDILRLGRRAQRLHDLVCPVLAVEILGAVVVCDKVWLSGSAQLVGGFVPLADGGGTIDKVPTGVKVQLCVYVESLQVGDGAGVRAAAGGTVTRRGGVGRVGSGGVVLSKGIKEFPESLALAPISEKYQKYDDILKSSRRNNPHHLRIRVQNLERMCGVPRHRTIIPLRHQSSLLFSINLLRPQLKPSLKVEKVLVMRLVDMRQDAQRAASRRIGAHQRECMARRRARHREAIYLSTDGDGVRISVVRDDVGAGRRGGVFEIKVVK